METGTAAERALALLEWPAVLELLAERCASREAARAARQLEPHLPVDAARRLHAETREALALLDDDPLPLGGFRDVRQAVEHATRGGVLEPAELVDVARTLGAIERLVHAFEAAERRQAAPHLAERAVGLSPHPSLAAAIEAAIDERGEVRDDATPLLSRLVRRRATLAVRVEEELARLRRDPDVAAALTDDFVTLRDGRHVLPVRTDRRQSVSGILHGRSGSGQSVYVEPQVVVDVNNDLRATEIEIEEEIARLLAELSSSVRAAAPALLSSLDAHRAIDLAVARARFARQVGATIPDLARDGDLVLPALAHPLLVVLSPPGAAVVRNDVCLSATEPCLVVTGPNTGGKTVLMKAVGLACLMASAGLPVVAEPGARVPVLGCVVVDIGDEQSLARSLSSFSAHVENLLAILRAIDEASPRPSLVLLDELMSGTDPDEGAALARALMEHLADRGARAIVTTHLGDLKAFASEHPRWRNASLEFDRRTLSPTYRVEVGRPGASAALMVAERLGLPAALLERARTLASDATLRADALLAELEDARREAREERAEADRQRRAAEAARREADERLRKLKEGQAQELEAERRRLGEELARLRERAAAVTADLQRNPALATAGEAIRELDALKRDLSATREPEPEPRAGEPAAPAELIPGARVTSVSLRRSGELLEEPDARGRARVRFGGLTVQVDVADLRAAREGAGGRPTSPRRERRGSLAAALRRAALGDEAGAVGEEGGDRAEVPFTPQGERNTCDLRGLKVDEALERVARFLATARRGGERRVILIHGHGTGALKQAVRESLGSELSVAGFRPGQDGEGGDGVTVAALS